MALLPGLAVINPTRRLALNTAAPIGARLVDAAFAAVYLRLLGRADVGVFTFLVVFTTFLDTLVDFGLNALMAREIPRRSVTASHAFRRINLLRLGLWLIGLPVVFVVYGPLRAQAELSTEGALAGWIFYLALAPSILAKTASGVLWAAERLDLTAGVSVLTTLVKTGLGALALFGGFGVVGLATASLATNVVTASVDWYLARQAAAIGSASLSRVRHGLSATSGDEDPLPRSGTTRSAPASSAFGGFRLRASMFRRGEFHSAPQELQAKERDSSLDSPIAWLRESWPLFLNQLLQGLFFWIDALLMLPLAGAVAAGTYGAAYKVSQGAGIISSSFTLALFPRLSRETDLSGAYRVALRVLLQIGLPLAAGVAILSAPIVALVGGREYLPDSATALAILICYLPLSYTNGLTQYVLIAAGKQRMLTMPFAAAFAFNLVANLILIPRFSYVGAAWVTVASEIVLLVPFRMLAAEVTHDVSLLQEARTPLFATLIMAPVVWWLRDAIHPLVAIPIGAAVYMVGLWALGGIDATQRRLLVQFIRP